MEQGGGEDVELLVEPVTVGGCSGVHRADDVAAALLEALELLDQPLEVERASGWQKSPSPNER